MWCDGLTGAPAGAIELLIAEDGGIPPWEVEDAPAIWIDRWLALKEARQDESKRGPASTEDGNTITTMV